MILCDGFMLTGHVHGPLYDMLQLPDIARPVVLVKQIHDVTGNGVDLFFHHVIVLVQKMGNEGINITFSLPKGRDLDKHHPQPVEQVHAESSLFTGKLKVFVGGTDDF